LTVSLTALIAFPATSSAPAAAAFSSSSPAAGRGSFIPGLAGNLNVDFTAVLNLVHPFKDDLFSGLYSGRARDVIAFGVPNIDHSQFRCIFFDDIQERTLGSALNGHGRHNDGIFQCVDQQADIDELIGIKSVVLVLEHRLQL